MLQMDYSKMIEVAAEQISDRLPNRERLAEKKSTRYIIRHRAYSQSDESPRTFNEIKKELYGHVWYQVLNEVVKAGTKQAPGEGKLAAEWVVLSLKRRNAVRGEIKYRRGHFDVPLANGRYRIYKRPEGFAVLPEAQLDRLPKTVVIEPYVFAGVIEEFDSHIPDMTEKANKVYQAHKAEMFEIQKERRAEEIRNRTVQSLAEQFLKPMGIEMTYHFNKDGTKVKLNLHKTLALHLDIPVEQLAATLGDPESILSQMK